jgi:hypothetical protein
MRGRRHLHLLEGEYSKAGKGGDMVGEGGHGAAVEDQLLQPHQLPCLLRQPAQLVVLPPHTASEPARLRRRMTCLWQALMG